VRNHTGQPNRQKRFEKMNKASIFVLGFVAAFVLGFTFKTIIGKQNNFNATKMKKITGIGGIFFKCKDPNKMKEWYKTHLCLDAGPYGASFEWRQAEDPTKKGSTQWSPFAETTKYFEPSTKDFMINYRVENLEALVAQLKDEGVTIVDKIEAFDYGKFVHILDAEGNKIELWEPTD
jgi:predicted enzyme related to lactoylglutathione lyase